jgi:cell volume regulation protein A
VTALRTSNLPAPALFLVAAALLREAIPGVAPSIRVVEWIATAALVVILFDGGASIGLRRFRASAVPVTLLGTIGTFATAGLATAFAHWAFGLHWLTAGLLGAAVAPTDPAVMFSVLGGREIDGRTKTILEGESGANDPVGIALMLGLLQLATHHDASFWIVVRTFVEQMAIGLAFGVLGGLLVRRVPRGKLVVAGAIFALAYVAHGSGFIAVFVAGLLADDVRPQLQERLSAAAEVVVFVALGVTVAIASLSASRWLEGLALAAFVALVARPVAAWPLLAPIRLRRGEKLFVVWGGLKGAVPILLASYALAKHVDDAQRIYELVFVVVLASVVVQGSTLPAVARRLTPRGERSA